MEDNIFDKVHEVDLKKTMEKSYIDYAMSVIDVGSFHRLFQIDFMDFIKNIVFHLLSP